MCSCSCWADRCDGKTEFCAFIVVLQYSCDHTHCVIRSDQIFYFPQSETVVKLQIITIQWKATRRNTPSKLVTCVYILYSTSKLLAQSIGLDCLSQLATAGVRRRAARMNVIIMRSSHGLMSFIRAARRWTPSVANCDKQTRLGYTLTLSQQCTSHLHLTYTELHN